MFARTAAILNRSAMSHLRSCRILTIGLGGVGSWCAEALVRSGAGHITLVDPDVVEITNINRQLPATSRTIGEPKAEVMARRLREINPAVTAVPFVCAYTRETALRFNPQDYDIVIDAIDSLDEKAFLINTVQSVRRPALFSSMGAAGRMDPTAIRLANFDKVTGDAVAKSLRRRFHEKGLNPPPFKCAYSLERATSLRREEPLGSIMPVCAAFGLTLAAAALKYLQDGSPIRP